MRSRNIVRKGLVELSRARHNVTRLRHKPAPGMPSFLDRLLREARKSENAYEVAVRKYLRQLKFQDPRSSVAFRLGELTDAVGYAASYLMEAKEQICRAGSALVKLDMPAYLVDQIDKAEAEEVSYEQS
jgi:hypothetical protein